MKVLVINAGSSSLKFQLLDPSTGEVFAKGLCDRIGLSTGKVNYKTDNNGEKVNLKIDKELPNHFVAINVVLEMLTSEEHGVIESMDEIEAVGHRVVHGGEHFSSSVLITEEVKDAIRDVVPLAPLHNPPNLLGIEACELAMPNTPMVAVFDTAFHQTMPASSYMYALPLHYYEQYSIRRYGFHGTSHAYVSEKAAEHLNRPYDELKIITCHLGNGGSITAVENGKSIDTSMGMTPLAGIPMGTRSGDIDPAIIKYLMDENDALSAADIDKVLNKQSGMLAISGISSDMRDIEDAAAEGHERSQLAIEMYVKGVKKFIGSYMAEMNGADVIVFTAGIGENSALFRELILSDMEGLGIILDKERNNNAGDVDVISSDDSNIVAMAISTDEEYYIANETSRVLSNN